jgi:hypothetical protein
MQVLPLLKTGTQAWQPSDFLPESSDPDFEDKVGRQQLLGCGGGNTDTLWGSRCTELVVAACCDTIEPHKAPLWHHQRPDQLAPHKHWQGEGLEPADM